MGMTLEQEGLLIRICAYQWESGRRLPLDAWQAAHALGLNPKNFRRVFAELLNLGKVTAHADGYGSERAEAELAAAVSATGRDRPASRIRENPANTARQSRKDCETIANQSPILAQTCVGIQSPPIEPITNTQEPIPPNPLKGARGDKSEKLQIAKRCFDEYRVLAKRLPIAEVPRESSFNDRRAKGILAVLRDQAGRSSSDSEMLQIWSEALSKAERSPWIRGETSARFKLTLSFLCRPDNFSKLIEGGYDGTFATAGAPHVKGMPSSGRSKIEAIMGGSWQ